MGSKKWAEATASAFDLLRLEECAEVAKPEWWNDEGLKALSARAVRAAPNEVGANAMRALVWCCTGKAALGRWGLARQRSSRRRLRTLYFERAAALCPAPARGGEGRAHPSRGLVPQLYCGHV